MDEFNSNGTYYNPPMSSNTDAPGNEGEYHYSYNQGYNGYTPETPNNNEPPKKSKAGKIAITVLVICLILAVVGVLLNVWINWSISPQILLGGMFSGLLSIGLHQIFKNLIEFGNSKEDK